MIIPKWSRTLVLSMILVSIIVNVLGYTHSLYVYWWWFDRFLHAFTMAAITLWLGLYFILDALRPACVKSARGFILVLSVGIAVGTIWEVAESAFDGLASGDVIKGKYDTMLDLVMDTIGTAMAALVATLSVNPGRR